jgi:lactate permease
VPAHLSMLGQLTTAWGAMGVAVVLTASLARLPVEQVGSLTALLSLPTAIVLSLVCLQVSGGKAAVRRWWVLTLAAATILTGGAWLLSRTVGVELMGILSSTLTLALLGGVGALVSRRASHARGTSDKGSKGETKRDSFWLAATPYVLLTFFLLLSRLVPPLRTGHPALPAQCPGHAGQCNDGLARSRCGCSRQPVCVDLALVSRSGSLVDRF